MSVEAPPCCGWATTSAATSNPTATSPSPALALTGGWPPPPCLPAPCPSAALGLGCVGEEELLGSQGSDPAPPTAPPSPSSGWHKPRPFPGLHFRLLEEEAIVPCQLGTRQKEAFPEPAEGKVGTRAAGISVKVGGGCCGLWSCPQTVQAEEMVPFPFYR